MRRQGWAFSLGMLMSGITLAQPPASDERFPPAPELPGGVVVSKPLEANKTANKTEITVTPLAIKRASLEVTEAPALPPPAVTNPTPYTGPITTVMLPSSAPSHAQCAPVACAPASPCASGHCQTGGYSHLPEWLKYRSNAKQSGCLPTPYHPPLYAWFPSGCVTNKPGAHCAPTSPCASGACNSTVPLGPVPMVTHIPGLPGTPMMNVPTPTLTPPLSMPTLAPTPMPGNPSVASQFAEPDPLAGFRKINDGLSFTPGGSPMAAPMKPVVKPVSRPK